MKRHAWKSMWRTHFLDSLVYMGGLTRMCVSQAKPDLRHRELNEGSQCGRTEVLSRHRVSSRLWHLPDPSLSR